MANNVKEYRDFYGRIYGTTEVDFRGTVVARDWPSQMILGYYYPDRDVTTDFYGRVLSNGNILTSLFTLPK